MLKFFRKYNRIILVFGGSILMVLFLLPGTQLFVPDPYAATIGRVGNVELTMGDKANAENELVLVQQLGLSPLIVQSEQTDRPLQWLLMLHEARQQGVYISTAEARAYLDSRLSNSGVTAKQLAVRSNTTEQFLVQAVQHHLMTEGLASLMYLQSQAVPVPRVSSPQVRHFVRDMQSRVTVRMVAVDAEAMLEAVEEPTQQELLDAFEVNKADPPGRSKPYGFGYRLPSRVKLEYVAVPLNTLEAKISANDIDDVEAQRFYLQNPDEFREKPVNPLGEPLTDPNNPTAAPPGPVKPYRDVAQSIKDRLARQKQIELQTRIVKHIQAQLNEQVRLLPKDTDGYYAMPAGYAPLSFEQLQSQIQDSGQFGVLLTTVRDDQWRSAEDIGKFEGFGDAEIEISGFPVPVEAYIMSAKELNPPPTSRLTALKLQVNVAAQPVTDAEGTVYIFRLTAADPAHVPASLDEVRDAVTRDVKRLKAYKKLVETKKDEIRAAALDGGLDKVAETYKTKVETLDGVRRREFSQDMFGRFQAVVPTLAVVGQNEAFIDSVFEVAERIRAAGGVDKAKAEDKIAALPVDMAQKLCVIQLIEYNPANIEQFNIIKSMAPMYIGSMVGDVQTPGPHPLSFEALKQRVGYVAEDAPDEPAPDAGTTAAK